MEKLKIEWENKNYTEILKIVPYAPISRIISETKMRVNRYVQEEQKRLDGNYENLVEKVKTFYKSLENPDAVNWESNRDFPSVIEKSYEFYEMEVSKAARRAENLHRIFVGVQCEGYVDKAELTGMPC